MPRTLTPPRAKKHATRAALPHSNAAPRARMPVADIALAEKPRWNAADHTLTWRRQVVKHFKAAAPFQEAILAAFEAAGWPSCILVECVARNGLDGKGRLRNTLTNLTTALRPYLRFRLEGNGARVCWEPR